MVKKGAVVVLRRFCCECISGLVVRIAGFRWWSLYIIIIRYDNHADIATACAVVFIVVELLFIVMDGWFPDAQRTILYCR